MGDDEDEIDTMFHVDGEDSTDASFRVMSAGTSKDDTIIGNNPISIFGGDSTEDHDENS
jgi:hypothetical protein